ncbi:hypothetical protein [Paenibacillus tianjinensis]|uniref:Fur-regulated basic protein A n=1 Tax=Paenibacillus tianjinensis TaxID=2810347 RepID=A0ABX7LD63_9BACL|nr:hypothetical protein [Paenibacillus tianjinensis]QSF45876.1 hypothetical protein JRJ22_04365 [Paenibacillus tianjinensis]
MKLLDIFRKNEIKHSRVKKEIEKLGKIQAAYEMNDIESLMDLHHSGLGKRGDDLHGNY